VRIGQRSLLWAVPSGAVLLTAALLARALPPPARPMPADTGLIRGRVVDAAGQPIVDAIVTLGGRGGPPDRVLVDTRGRFVFRALPAGTFSLVASRPGDVGGGPDQRNPAGTPRPVELAGGQALDDVTLRLWAAGALTGTVTDAAGGPAPNVDVHVFRRALVEGRWTLTAGASTSTDDLGHYRLDGLATGDYAIAARPDRHPDTSLLVSILNANPAEAADMMSAFTATSGVPATDDRVRPSWLTFYPDAIDPAGATLVNVRPGTERERVDLRLDVRAGLRVSGAVSAASGTPEGLVLQLVPAAADDAPAPIDADAVACDADGRFTFSGVPAGRYVIRTGGAVASPSPPGAGGPPVNSTWSGRTTVVVGTRDVDDVTVPVARTVSASGRVTFDGHATPATGAQIAQIAIRLEPVDVSAAAPGDGRATVQPDGRFRAVDLPPGEYRLRVTGAPPGWTPRSAMLNGRDLLDEPLDVGSTPIDDVVVSMGDPLPRVAGVAHDASGAADVDASVLVFPADRDLRRDSSPEARRLRSARTTAAGRFAIPNLPPGDYEIVAVAGDAPVEWQAPDVLDALATKAAPLRIADGASSTLDLTAVPLPAAPRPLASATGRAPAKTRAADSARRPSSTPRTAAPAKPVSPSKAAALPPAARRASAGSTPAATSSATGASATMTGTLDGTVTDAVSHAPVAGALVLVAGTDVGAIRVTATDARGQFAFDALPAGHFLVGAGTPAYLPGLAGATRPGRPGLPIDLEAGQRVSDVSIALARGAVIAGRVLDDRECPVPGVRVRVLQHRAAAGDVTFGGDTGDPAVVTTDVHGAYRVFDLPPGEYVVAVQARGVVGGLVRRLTDADVDGGASTDAAIPAGPAGTSMGWSPAYAPGTSVPTDAGAIDVAAGDVRAHTDVHVRLARFVRVEGTVAPMDDAAGRTVQVALRPRGQRASGALLAAFNTRPGADGRFTFQNVPPGAYTLVARELPPAPPPDRRGDEPPPDPPRWAAQDLDVAEAAVTGVRLTLAPALSIAGRVVWRDGPPADAPGVRVGVRPTPGSAVPAPPGPVPVDAEGRFTIAGLLPGRYRLVVQVANNDVLQAPDWSAASSTMDGAEGDPLDVPFELAGPGAPPITIALTRDSQDLDGSVRDADGRPVRDCPVVAFPADRRLWSVPSRRIATRQTNHDGLFVFGVGVGLPPGDYLVAAAPDLRPGESADVLRLDELSHDAARVTLGPNDSRTVDLRVKRP